MHDVGIARIERDDHDAGRGHEDEEIDDHHRRERDALVDVEDGGGDEQHDERQQLGHLVADVRDDLLVDASADLDRVDERPEVVVGEDHPAGLLRDLAAGPHRHADVGLFERGRVVDRVAGHRHDQALLLHDAGETELVLGRDPTEHVELRQPAGELVVGQCLQLAPADRAGSEPELLADGLGGDGVVAGDHAHVDAGAERGAAPRPWLRLGAGR